MMSGNSKSRYRERKQPPARPISYKIGELRRYKWNNSTGKYNTSPVEVIPQFASNGSNRPSRWERMWDQTHGSPPYDDGGPMTIVDLSWPQSTVQGSGIYSWPDPNPGVDKWVYEGSFSEPSFTDTISEGSYFNNSLWSPGGSLVPDLTSLGAQAYKRMRPDLPKAPFAEMIGEGRDIIPMMKSTAKNAAEIYRNIVGSASRSRIERMPKKAADEFLNQSFGWIPFVSGINQILDTTIFMDQYLHDLKAGNDRWMRKERRLESTETVVFDRQIFNGGVTPSLGGFQIAGCCNTMVRNGSTCTAYARQETVTKTESWGVGWFKYYRPEFDSTLEGHDSNTMAIRRLMTIYGLRVSPSLVWELTPWSWLADYFSNAGDVIDNMTAIAQDGVAAKQFYVMRRESRVKRLTVDVNWRSGLKTMSWERVINLKQRADADNPFSFHLSGSLSAKQIAIMSALGISRTA
jgi:hypothetical protein